MQQGFLFIMIDIYLPNSITGFSHLLDKLTKYSTSVLFTHKKPICNHVYGVDPSCLFPNWKTCIQQQVDPSSRFSRS